MIKRVGIAVRLAFFIILAALGIAYTASEVFYQITYDSEIEDAERDIKELFQTVSSTASIAAFVEDEELVKEVVNGLVKSKKIKAAAFTSDKITYAANAEQLAGLTSQEFIIFNPFIQEEVIAKLKIYPDLNFIQKEAKNISSGNSLALYILAVFVTIAAIIICFYLITRPLVYVSRNLHDIEPGTNARLLIPKNQGNSEITGLIQDTNHLLTKVEEQFIKERGLRKEIEFLEQRFRMLFENARAPIVLLATDGEVILHNEAFELLLEKIGVDYDKSDVAFGELLVDLFEEPQDLVKSVEEAFARDEFATGEHKLKSFKEHVQVWVQVVVSPIEAENNKKFYQVTLNDISRRREELEALAKEAEYDALTGILNRNGGEKVIEKALFDKKAFALVLLDLNGFKQVNDVYGHDAGDEVLVFVAEQLKNTLRKQDIPVRWGGDEFVLLLQVDEFHRQTTTLIMDKVMEQIKQPFYFGENNEEVYIGFSAGVSFYPLTTNNMNKLLKLADVAMYEAKQFKHTNPEKYLFFADK